MQKINSNILITIFLAIIIGFISGLLGYSITGLNNVNIPFWGQLDLSNIDSDRQILIEQPRSVLVKQDVIIRQVENNLLPTLVNIYPIRQKGDVLNQIFTSPELLGHGFILTSNGWVVTTNKVIKNINAKYVVVGYQSKQYELSGFVEDEITGLIFGKMEAVNLPVVDLGQSNKIVTGQSVVIVSNKRKVVSANISDIGYDYTNRASVVQSSMGLNKRIFINHNINDLTEGSVMANLKGEVIGMLSNQTIVPVDYFRNIVNQVLNNQAIKRADLGVNYIDLSHVDGLIDIGENGALVYLSPDKTSPVYGQVFGGDIIKKVNDEDINTYFSLSELINKYDSGDRIDLSILRANQEIAVEATLK